MRKQKPLTKIQRAFVWCCLIGNIVGIIYIAWLMIKTLRS